MVDEDACNQGHVLGIGSDGKFSMGTISDLPRKDEVKLHILFPVDSEKIGGERNLGRSSSRNTDQDEKDCDASREVCGEERRHAKKKLRLTTEQATLLQNSFEEHRTLNYEQKQELADQLNLQPKQVEIWFQNRRARTKFKRTEMDCEYLKKYCQRLREENQRLKDELMELKTMKQHGSAPFLIHRLQRVPTDTCNMCLSCQETSTSSFGRSNSNTFAKAS